MKKYLILLLCLNQLLSLNGQVPTTDPHWLLKWGDEYDFNMSGTESTTAQLNYLKQKWNLREPYWPFTNLDTFKIKTVDGTNHTVQLGYLSLYAKRMVPEYPSYNVKYKCINVNGIDSCWFDTTYHTFPWTIGYLFTNGDNQYGYDNKYHNLNYGYYEMRFRYNSRQPYVVIDTVNQVVTTVYPHKGIAYSWWGYRENSTVTWNEIDFFETSGWGHIGMPGPIQTHNYLNGHYQSGMPNNNNFIGLNKVNFDDITSSGKQLSDYYFFQTHDTTLDIDDTWHKIGVEFTPDMLTYFWDDERMRSVTTNGRIDVQGTASVDFTNHLQKTIPLNMEMIINADESGFHNYLFPVIPDQYTDDVNRMDVDYIRYYKMECADVSAPMTACAFNPSSANTTHYLHVILGGLCPNIMPSGQYTNVRALEYIEMNDGFEVPIGADYFADDTPCIP